MGVWLPATISALKFQGGIIADRNQRFDYGITFDHVPLLRRGNHGRWATEIRPAPKAAPHKGARVEIVNSTDKGCNGKRGTFQAVLRLSGNKWEVKLDDNQIAWILLKDIRVIPKKSWWPRLLGWKA